MSPILPSLASDALTSEDAWPIDESRPDLIECSSTSRISYSTAMFIFLMLMFYALALWDRWLNLRLREANIRERRILLQARTALPFYGTTCEGEDEIWTSSSAKPPQKRSKSAHSLPRITITPPPSPLKLLSPQIDSPSEHRPWDAIVPAPLSRENAQNASLLTPPMAHSLSDVSS
ncbi:hypothetical protein MIND_00899300 [Mycena indigotica]|uniref:Uncharacterized protein n=1 Tax=Mycena indigotica TaxID=2126181 RepID=A0A8H6VZI9_9AGAR|nr:uncharacterized protein MIND_00899300 [Mycena indigotica]KAF7299492.1 hypothetical protein MIND_00899300 [Mycena indigotica]